MNNAPFVYTADLLKATTEAQYTLSPILVPDKPDLQGDVVSADEIQKAVWGMPTHDKLMDLEHYLVNEKLGRPVEKYVLPADTMFQKVQQLPPEAAAKVAQIAQLQQELVQMGVAKLVPKEIGRAHV